MNTDRPDNKAVALLLYEPGVSLVSFCRVMRQSQTVLFMPVGVIYSFLSQPLQLRGTCFDKEQIAFSI